MRILLAPTFLLLACATTPRTYSGGHAPAITPWPSEPEILAAGQARFDAVEPRLAQPVTAANAQELYDVIDGACDVGVDEACVVLRERFTPSLYPEPPTLHTIAAADASAAGEMEYECRLASTGEARDCHVVVGIPYGLNDSVKRYVESARFEPATFSGVPINSELVLYFRFMSSGTAAATEEATHRAAFRPDDPPLCQRE
jgi:hypothetical protein